jgi:hypothetical protein
MAQFRAMIQGCRGEASRLGSKSSGITTQTNAWDLGVQVEGFYDDKLGDCFRVTITGGSNQSNPSAALGTFCRRPNGSLQYVEQPEALRSL